MTHLVLDLDPPAGAGFAVVVKVAHLVRQALADLGLEGAVKTSGAKGLHVFVPIDVATTTIDDAAAATRAIAARAEQLDPAIATTAFIKEDREGKVFVDSTRVGGATVVAAYSPPREAGRAGVVPACRGRTSTASSRRRSRSSPLSTTSATPTPGRR